MSKQPTKANSRGAAARRGAAAASRRAATASSQPAAAAAAATAGRKRPSSDALADSSSSATGGATQMHSSKKSRGEEVVAASSAGASTPTASSGQAAAAAASSESVSRQPKLQPPAVGLKRNSTTDALADSTSSNSAARGSARKKKQHEMPEGAEGASASSSAASAAAPAASSYSPPPQRPLQPRLSFFKSVQTLMQALQPILSALHSARRAIDDPGEAEEAELLQEEREELQQIELQLAGAPQLQQQQQPRIERLKENFRGRESWLADLARCRQAEEERQQQLCAQLARTEGEQSACQLAVVLANGVTGCRWSCAALPTSLSPRAQELPRRWQVRACAVLEQLAAELTADDIRANSSEVISAFAEVGLLAALDRLLAQTYCDCVFEIDSSPYLSMLAGDWGQHVIPFTPLLHFIRRGLDPTSVCDKYPQSALQLAREHVQANPLLLHGPDNALLQSMNFFEQLEEGGWLPNLATERLAQQTEGTWGEENQKREELHTRFMHALMSAWRAHSSKVRALLLEAAPDQLIPDLANICAGYLDLEPAEKRRQ